MDLKDIDGKDENEYGMAVSLEWDYIDECGGKEREEESLKILDKIPMGEKAFEILKKSKKFDTPMKMRATSSMRKITKYTTIFAKIDVPESEIYEQINTLLDDPIAKPLQEKQSEIYEQLNTQEDKSRIYEQQAKLAKALAEYKKNPDDGKYCVSGKAGNLHVTQKELLENGILPSEVEWESIDRKLSPKDIVGADKEKGLTTTEVSGIGKFFAKLRDLFKGNKGKGEK